MAGLWAGLKIDSDYDPWCAGGSSALTLETTPTLRYGGYLGNQWPYQRSFSDDMYGSSSL
jgi:hypothetical protein